MWSRCSGFTRDVYLADRYSIAIDKGIALRLHALEY
jgi:hypothetical protein